MARRILFLAILSLLAWVLAAPAASPPAEKWATFDQPGKFITALCATDEALWIGTEDHGLWRLDLKADPAAKESWKHFSAKDTATDHVYGLAVDSSGRLWVGTVNQGVSVYNGNAWRNYGVLDGCSGERVFAIAADPDPKRGNVWIGTDHGLTCWLPDLTAKAPPERGGSPDPPRGGTAVLAKGTWRTYTQADGLPSQQIYTVAVSSFGRVCVGTECDGLAWADLPYDKWQPARADAEKSGDAGESPGCGGGTALGLPSNLANALAVLKDGTTVVGTNYGLGIRRAGQFAWTTWQGLSKQPYENYARGLAVDPAGGLWIATRHKGLARLDLGTMALKTFTVAPKPKVEKDKSEPVAQPPSAGKTANNAQPGAAVPQKPAPPPPSLPDNYVFSVAVTSSGDVWAGAYGGGLARLKTPLAVAKAPPVATGSAVSVGVSPQFAIRNCYRSLSACRLWPNSTPCWPTWLRCRSCRPRNSRRSSAWTTTG